MVIRAPSRPLASLMTDVASDLAYLVQTEFRMARAEIGEKTAAASSAGVFLAAGGATALAGFVVLLLAVAQWLTVAGLPHEWSLLLVALVALAIGAGVAMVGVNRMKARALLPTRTIEQMREDYVVAREHVR